MMSDNLTTLKEDNSVEVAAPKPVLEAITKTKKEEVNQPIAQGALGASQAQEKDNAQRQLSEKRQANPIMAKQALMRDAQARLDETKPERAESKQLATTRLQEVQRVFEQHHVALKNIYLRELSDSLNIKGELHLKLAITATGKVSQCEVISSNLNNLGLETKLVALVKSFEFGEGEAWQRQRGGGGGPPGGGGGRGRGARDGGRNLFPGEYVMVGLKSQIYHFNKGTQLLLYVR
ncbi:MAG: AgmX/PglI C-terminal domain-containing protein [Moraxellaceae bacterium]|nr:AgmX/PglI C-terminal domain-containing protein [Moraxellaceae bacterium]